MVVPVLWALLAALALALGWTTATAAFAWIGYLMLAVWLIGAAMARLSERRLTATREVSVDRISPGEQVAVEVTVANTSALPALWVTASEPLPVGLPMTGVRGRVGPLAARGRFSFRYSLHGARRGYYELAPTIVRTGDLFGLAQRERRLGQPAHVIVYPRILPIVHARLPSRRPAGETRARQRVLEDPTQVVGIRPYQRGDGLRRVHWRATAHTGRLQSKLFEVTAQVQNVVIANFRRADYSDSPAEAEEAAELAAVTAASVAYHVLDKRQRVGLVALGRDPAGESRDGVIRVAPGRGREQLPAILSALGRIELGLSPGLDVVLQQEKEHLSWASLIVIVTPRLQEALPAVLDLRKLGFEVHALLVGRWAELSYDVSGIEALGIGATRVASEAAIRDLGI